MMSFTEACKVVALYWKIERYIKLFERTESYEYFEKCCDEFLKINRIIEKYDPYKATQNLSYVNCIKEIMESE